MFLKRLSLINFKSYTQADINFTHRINCFVGNNGQGKTNLLDAIHYLSLCKSAFNAIDSQNVRHGEEFFVVQGIFYRSNAEENIYLAVKRNEGKVVKRNGKEYPRLADHVGLVPTVMVSPADSSLILDGSEERRKFLNGVISQFDKSYLDQVIKYNRVLAQRNKLLKDLRFNSSGVDIIDVFNQQLDALGTAIYKTRLEFISKLIPVFQKVYSQIAGSDENVSLEYKSQLADGRFLEQLQAAFPKDRAIEFTSVGIHKDDLVLLLNGNPIKKEGSQGQQKTYLIALKVAQFDFLEEISGYKPVLLLDDIFDKLDMDRVEQFIRMLSDGGNGFGQVFITDTNKHRLDSILEKLDAGYTLFEVKHGNVTEIAQQDGSKEE
ncbi:MAG: DNA replication/repair protein RecF [Bacteroidales bacterium]|nr:DNA replication/repair protein RecF [Bacteroidales bacterium]MBN2748107.1 DNA replication/repair protein RecF [Bacteroidales bacterium]